jgi:hypothetical protein
MDWGGMTGISQIWLAGKSPINAKNGNVNENIIKLNGGGWIFPQDVGNYWDCTWDDANGNSWDTAGDRS